MMRKFNIIAPIVFLMVFLMPSVVKFEHHHESFICNAKHEKHYHVYHEKCEICNFEFSAFSSGFDTFDLPNHQPLDSYVNHYTSRYSSALSQHSFLLRGPPNKQI
ncbi:MAG: hypothetical protein WCX31_19495 [Salinivirgaceae bacterium]